MSSFAARLRIEGNFRAGPAAARDIVGARRAVPAGAVGIVHAHVAGGVAEVAGPASGTVAQDSDEARRTVAIRAAVRINGAIAARDTPAVRKVGRRGPAVTGHVDPTIGVSRTEIVRTVCDAGGWPRRATPVAARTTVRIAQAEGELRAAVCQTAIRHWQGPAFSHTGLGRRPVILRHPIPRAIAAIYSTRRRPVVRHRAVVCEQHRPPLARCVGEQRSQQNCWTGQRAAKGRVRLWHGSRFRTRPRTSLGNF